MATRLPASQRTREELAALIEGHLSTASAKDELVKLATRLIVEEALEGEAGDTIGRDYYEHGAQPGQGYRNGYRSGRLKTAEGLMEYSAPQIAGRAEPFRSAIREHLKGHTQGLEDLAIEMLARGLSVRDIEDAFKDENGRLLLSKTAVSQLGERLWEDYQAFAQARLERIRNHLSVCRWHCRAFEAWRQTRTCSGGLGLYDRGPSGAAAYDGRLQGGCRDGDRVLRGHEEARSQ
jgi:transposase-like protein